jgi:hypothetical protein
MVPEERSEASPFGKISFFKHTTLLKYKLPKFTLSSVSEIQKKAGIFCQIVCHPNSELEPLKTFFKRDFLISAAFIPLFF